MDEEKANEEIEQMLALGQATNYDGVSFFRIASQQILQNADEATKIDYLHRSALLFQLYGQLDLSIYLNELNYTFLIKTEDLATLKITLSNLATVYDQKQENDKAIKAAKEAISILQSDIETEINCHFILGTVYHRLNQNDLSKQLFEKALSLALSHTREDMTVGILNNYTILCLKTRQFDLAESLSFEAMRRGQIIEDWQGVADAYSSIGLILAYRGDPKQAIMHHEVAIELNQKTNNANAIIKELKNIGTNHYDLGNYEKFLELNQQIEKLASQLGFPDLVASAHLNYAKYHMLQGDLQRSVFHAKRALDMASSLQNDSLTLSACNILGNSYKKGGNVEMANRLDLKALEISIKIGDKIEISNCYNNLGGRELNRPDGDINVALEYLEKSLEITESIGYKEGVLDSSGNLGALYFQERKIEKAKHHLEKAISIGTELRLFPKLIIAKINFARCLNEEGDYDSAHKLLEECINTVKENNLDSLLPDIYYTMAQCYKKSNQPAKAIQYLEQSIQLSDRYFSGIVEDTLSITLSRKDRYSYVPLIVLLIESEAYEKAFNYIEQYKSRGFLKLIANCKLEINVKTQDEKLKQLLEREKTLIAERQDLQNNFSAVKDYSRVNKVQEGLNEIYQELIAYDEVYVNLKTGKTAKHEDLVKYLEAQSEEVLIIEYFIYGRKLFIFTFSKSQPKVKLTQVDLDDRFYAMGTSYYKEIHQFSNFGDIGSSWIGLSKYLIDPIKEELNHCERIIFVPFSDLHAFPLHILRHENEPIISKLKVTYLPSASILINLNQRVKKKVKRALVLGYEFEKEAMEVSSFFEEGTLFQGTNANRENFFANLMESSPDLVHFSTHGYFNTRKPMSSGLALADGLLTAEQFLQVRADIELLVLSACQTSQNRLDGGDDLLGFNRSLFQIGVKNIIGSLWSVDSGATMLFMQFFYESFCNQEQDISLAFKTATNQLRATKGYEHPFYWGGFVLSGIG